MRNCFIPRRIPGLRITATIRARRHIHLTQITPQNVGNLTLAWAFQTNQPAQIKSSPLLVDGVLYFTVPDNIWAVDARSGHMIWHYNRPATKGDHIGHRGVAMYKGWLYFTTPDAHLISLDAKDGKVRWDKIIADVERGYWTTMAPLVVKNHVIAGVGGDLDNLPGLSALVRSRDRCDTVAVGRNSSDRNSQCRPPAA